MKTSALPLVLLLCAAPLAAAGAGEPVPDSVEELTGALLRSGAISQPDWWKIKQLRAAELERAAADSAAQAAEKQKIQPPAVPPTPTPQPPAAQISQGVALGKGVTMKIGALAQFRYTWADAPVTRTNSSAFAVKTARVKFSGDLPNSFKYSLQFAFERVNTTSTADAALYDFALIYAPRPEISLTAGQIVMPFGAETMASSDQLDFAARYYAQDRMLNPSGDHDTGIMASGKVMKERLQYYAGAFNGKGANYSDNDNEKFLYAGRLVWNSPGWKFLDKKTSLALGASGLTDSTRKDPSSLPSDAGSPVFTRAYRRYVWGGDAALRVGPGALKGEYIVALLDGRGADPEVHAYGWHATFAYRLPGEKLELLGRYQVYDPNTAHVTSKDLRWATLGANWFMDGHREKVQINYTFKQERKSITDNNELVVQMQLSF